MWFFLPIYKTLQDYEILAINSFLRNKNKLLWEAEMAVGSPKVICREQGNMHRMWYCTESSTCFRSWAKVGWMGAVDHTVERTGQDQADFPASSENFRVDSVMSFTWGTALLPVHESLFPWKSEQPFLFVQDFTHASKCIILIIYCYSSAWWLELRKLLSQTRQHKLIQWERRSALFLPLSH